MPDLPRQRPKRPSWVEPIVRRMTPAVKVLVVIYLVLYFFYVFVPAARAAMDAHLAMGPRFFAGEVWQPVTSLLFNNSFPSFALNLVGLWFMGWFETTHGMRRFLLLFFGAGIAANLAMAGVSLLVGQSFLGVGCSLSLLGLFVAMGRIYGRQEMQLWGALFLQARVISLFFVAFGVVASLAQRDWGMLAATLVATAVGYLLAAPGGLRELYDLARARRLRRRYRVLEGGAGRRGRQKYWN